MKNNKGQEVNDQHINVSGRSRQLSVGKFLPRDWGWVRVTRTRSDDNNVWIHVERLVMIESKQMELEPKNPIETAD